MSRPYPALKITTGQCRLEWFILLLSAALVAGTCISYFSLPDRIPVHLGAAGQPDRWGARAEVWILPGIYLVLGLLLRWLNSRPDLYNYSIPITLSNAQQVYQMGAHFIRLIRVWVAVIFCIVQAGMVDAAFRQGSTPFIWLLWPAVAGLMVTTVWGVYRFYVSAPK